MARLKIRLRGKTVYDIPLAADHQYVAGRKEDCDIVLEPEKGISREHFRLSFTNGAWTVEVVSRYGEVHYQGESQTGFTLEHGSTFTIPPYEFEFQETSAEAPMQSDAEAGALVPTTGDSFEDASEKTIIGVAPTTAYVKVVDSNNETKDLIRLEAGDSWIAGRDPQTQILIKDQRVSRRQFEIRKMGAGFSIIDMGSVNGTLLNGVPVSSSEPVPLKSGDSISVLDNFFYFELHDAHFKSRLEMVNVQPLSPLVTSQDHEVAPYPEVAGALLPDGVNPYELQAYQGAHGALPGPVLPPPPVTAPPVKKGFDFQKHRPKVIAAAVLILALAYLFSDNSSQAPIPAPTAAVAPGSWQDLFAKLTPEQQALVRQRYKDAKNMYMQGKYELAKQELSKIQELIPDYEDIKEIHRLAEEAVFIQEQKRRQEEIEKDRAEAEEKIQKQVVICKKLMGPGITMEQLDECFSPVLQFNPEHPKIMELKAQVESITAQREAKIAERAAYQALVGRMSSVYSKAADVHKKGRPLEAIAAYEKVLEAKLPDPNGLKDKARRNIASIRKMMNSKTADLQAQADAQYGRQNLKGAIMTLRKARQVDPENGDLVDKIQLYTNELKKQMMVLYQEGILEESFGNVDGGENRAGAKEKWKKIIELDVTDGDYYKKAYIKLKKYGAL